MHEDAYGSLKERILRADREKRSRNRAIALGIIALLFLGMLWGFLITMHAWNWIVAPIFDLRTLGFWHAAAFSVALSVFRHRTVTIFEIRTVAFEASGREDPDSKEDKLWKSLTYYFGWYAFLHAFVFVFSFAV